jgi:hypothetical protein
MWRGSSAQSQGKIRPGSLRETFFWPKGVSEMKKLKATRLIAAIGISVGAVSPAFAQGPDYIDDATGTYSASVGIAEYNAAIAAMCAASGPDTLRTTGNPAEPVWTAPLCSYIDD